MPIKMIGRRLQSTTARTLRNELRYAWVSVHRFNQVSSSTYCSEARVSSYIVSFYNRQFHLSIRAKHWWGMWHVIGPHCFSSSPTMTSSAASGYADGIRRINWVVLGESSIRTLTFDEQLTPHTLLFQASYYFLEELEANDTQDVKYYAVSCILFGLSYVLVLMHL